MTSRKRVKKNLVFVSHHTNWSRKLNLCINFEDLKKIEIGNTKL